MSKLRHWLANQLQTLWLLGPKKWAQANVLPLLMGLVLGLFAGVVFGAEVDSTRVTGYDWQAQDNNGAKISDHTRFDTAFVACLNNPSCVFVQGGKYRVTRGATPAPVTGVANLTWQAPTQNTDGTAITGSLCYRIEYGKGDFSQTVSTCSTSHQITGLSSGVWQFRVRAVLSGQTGEPSNVRTKTL